MTTFIPWLPTKMTSTFEWKSTVLVAADGTEQRGSCWNHPKVTFALEYDMIGPTLGGDTELTRKILRAVLAADPSEDFEIPLRYESTHLTSNVTAGGSVVSVNWAQAIDWLSSNRKVYIESDEDEDGYVGTISSVAHVGAAANVTLTAPIPSSFTASITRLCPVRTIRPLNKQALGRYRVEEGTWTITGVLQTLYMFNQGTGIDLTLYEELPVFDREAEQDGSNQIGEEFDTGIVLLGEPLTEGSSLFGASNIRRDLTFLLDGLDDWRWFKAFLFTVYGQRVPFFRSTYRDDLTLSAQPASPSSVLLIEDAPSYLPWIANVDTFKRLALEMSDGTVDYVRVVSAVDNLDGTQTLTLSVPYTRGALTIVKISFLEATRLATDIVVLDHNKNGNRMALNLQTLTGNWVIAPVES